MALKPTYPNNLRAVMLRAGKGPSELGEAVNTHRQNISRYALGVRKLTVPMAEKLAPLLDSTPEELLLDEDQRIIQRIPLLDWVSAGRLTATGSQIPVEDVPLLAFADLGRGDFFALKVSGSSMDRYSPEGSIIVVDRADQTLVSGRCYVFNHEGETTYKRWQPGDPPYLAPYSTDPSHGPIFIKKKKGFSVIGRVRRTLLDL